jgi:4-amino-4-deoxy-L-arabinose transferase-like glycosyltransferase
LAALLLLYLILAVAYGVIAPSFESPDEIGHFFTVKYIADRGQLPIPEKDLAREYLYGQEGTQPPLYYLVGAAILRGSGVPSEDAWAYLRVNPHTTCGSPHLTGNKAFLAHDPVRERFPWQGSILGLHVLRFYSTALGLVTLLGVYAIARLCCPRREGLPLLAVALTALNPQFLFVSAGVNNDNLLVALCTWGLYAILRYIRYEPTYLNSALAGVLIGLAVLTKIGGLLLLPLAALAILLGTWYRVHRAVDSQSSHRRDLRVTFGRWPLMLSHLLLLAGAALLIASWWYLRNALLYHDPMLIEHHLDIVSRRDPTPIAHILYEMPSIFYSYWGRFTCDISPGPWYYAFWGLVIIAGLGGVVAWWRRLSLRCRLSLVLLLVWFLLVFFGWFRWNLMASGVQGRLLFPATASVGVLVATGLAVWTRRRHWVRILLVLSWLGLSLGMLYGLIRPTFAPPPRHSEADELAIPSAADRAFVDGDLRLELLGYEVRPTDLEPGEALEVTLYLSAPQELTDTYSLGLWLVSAIPGDTTRLAGLDTWPGDGNYPTSAWQPGEIIVDTYVIPVPDEVHRAQAWAVQLNAYRMGDDVWLPFAQDGQVVGDRAILGLVRVGPSAQVEVPAASRLEPFPIFGTVVALRGAQAGYDEETGEVAVKLWWEALAPMEADYTVFVHLVDEDGQLAGDGDGPPLHGGFPTTMWQPGDGVVDEHIVRVPPDVPTGDYVIVVGWYDPTTGARLTIEGRDSYRLAEPIHVP